MTHFTAGRQHFINVIQELRDSKDARRCHHFKIKSRWVIKKALFYSVPYMIRKHIYVNIYIDIYPETCLIELTREKSDYMFSDYTETNSTGVKGHMVHRRAHVVVSVHLRQLRAWLYSWPVNEICVLAVISFL